MKATPLLRRGPLTPRVTCVRAAGPVVRRLAAPVAAMLVASLSAMTVACETGPPAADPSAAASSVAPVHVADVESPSAESTSAAPSVGTGSAAEAVAASPERSPTEVALAFIEAANGDDDAAARGFVTPECGECSGFVAQAGSKFQAVIAGDVRAVGKRAAATIDVMCGARRCDEAHLLLENGPDGWLVADITESNERLSAWLAAP